MRRSRRKEEYSEVFNKVFGTNIKWEKLSLAELEEFAKVLISREFCSKICGTKTILHEIVDALDKLLPEEEQGPIIKAIKKLIKGD